MDSKQAQNHQEMIQFIRSTVRQRIGRNYEQLYDELEKLSSNGLLELFRMVKEFDSQLDTERKEGRKDVAFRGRAP